jgi:HD domain
MSPSERVEGAARRSEPVRKALDLARHLHAGEFRELGAGVAFIEHPLAVADLLAEQDMADWVVAAGLLHDTIEYSDVEAGELRWRFGTDVAAIVQAVTEDVGIVDREQRREEVRARVVATGGEAQRVFAAEKVANVIAVREAYELRGEGVADDMALGLDDQIITWEDDMGVLFEAEEGVPLFDRLAEELILLWQQRFSNEPRDLLA